jgi:signal transduction histidine kinase
MAAGSWKGLVTQRRTDLLVAGGLLLWASDFPAWWSRGNRADILVMIGPAVVLAIPFLWRRSIPLPVLVLSAVIFGLESGRSQSASYATYAAAAAAALVAAYGLGAYGGRRARAAARWLGGLTLAAAAAIVALGLRSDQHRSTALPFALLGAALLLGEAQRARQEGLRASIDAAHLAERTRIARELHDILAHQLSAIAVQAGAVRLAPHSPGQQAGVLATVERLARDALNELGHLLGLLRKDPADELARAPAPTLGDIDILLGRARAAGVPVDLSVSGDVRPLPAGVELSAYRIVQEALTNVSQHAPAAVTRVDLRYGPDRLQVDVVNAASRLAGLADKSRRPGGRGLIGMRERAELGGGRLDASQRPGGGFCVTAVLPYEVAEAGRVE